MDDPCGRLVDEFGPALDERHTRVLAELLHAPGEAVDEFGPRDIEELFVYLYDELPSALQAQLRELEESLEELPERDEHTERRPRG